MIDNTRHQIFLSRRNLTTLLNKLDRKKKGEDTACTLIKYNDRQSFRNTIDTCIITAVEDNEYYVDFNAGPVHPADEPKSNQK